MRSRLFALLILLAGGLGVAPLAHAQNHDAVAIIIGNKAYRGGTPQVIFADHDATDMVAYARDVLGYEHVYRYDDITRNEFIQLFGTAERPETAQLASMVKGHEATTDVLVYYSGHGNPGVDHGAYLMPIDFVAGQIEDTAYSLRLLKTNLARLHVRSVVLVVDACFTGNSGGGQVTPGSPIYGVTDDGETQKGITVLTAAGMTQTANWDEKTRHGLFTSYFLRAVAGEAATDQAPGLPHKMTAAQVIAFVNDEMRFPSAGRGAQHAELEGPGDVLLTGFDVPRRTPVVPPPPPAPQPSPVVAPPPALPWPPAPVSPLTPRQVVPAPVPLIAETNDCDRLAQPPRRSFGRTGARTDGVAFGDINGQAALAACDAALSRFPNEVRFTAYRGRALERLQQYGASQAAYRVAAARGSAVAQNELAEDEAAGVGGVSRNDPEAARLYRMAADQGYAVAQEHLGSFYEQGRGGLNKDDGAAAYWYGLAASQGLAEGQVSLGRLYANGTGVPRRDDLEAARLFRLALAQNSADAQFWIGYFNETGRAGYRSNVAKAVLLYQAAARQGSTAAQARLREMGQRW